MSQGPATLTWRADFSRWAAGSAMLRNRIAIEVTASAGRVLDAAVQRAPERTGALKESGKVVQKGDMVCAVEFGIGLPDGRAVYQEYGTSHHAAQPYLTPSFVEETPVFIRRLAITTQGRVATISRGIQGDIGLGIAP